MKVKMNRTTFADGKLCEKGKTVEVSDKDGATLIALKKAVSAEKEEKKGAK